MRNTRFSKCEKFCIFCNRLYYAKNQYSVYNHLLVTELTVKFLLISF